MPGPLPLLLSGLSAAGSAGFAMQGIESVLNTLEKFDSFDPYGRKKRLKGALGSFLYSGLGEGFGMAEDELGEQALNRSLRGVSKMGNGPGVGGGRTSALEDQLFLNMIRDQHGQQLSQIARTEGPSLAEIAAGMGIDLSSTNHLYTGLE